MVRTVLTDGFNILYDETYIKNFYDVAYCVFSMDRWTNQSAEVDS